MSTAARIKTPASSEDGGHGPPYSASRRKSGSGQKRRIGTSVQRRCIDAFTFNGVDGPVLIIAGVHGDEPKSVFVARRVVEELAARSPKRMTIVVPVANPDDRVEATRRRNM